GSGGGAASDRCPYLRRGSARSALPVGPEFPTARPAFARSAAAPRNVRETRGGPATRAERSTRPRPKRNRSRACPFSLKPARSFAVPRGGNTSAVGAAIRINQVFQFQVARRGRGSKGSGTGWEASVG